MVEVVFKLSEAGRVGLLLPKPEPLQDVLQKCAAQAGIELGGYIAIRNGKVLTAEKMVHDDDVIDVFPALSGG